MQMPDLRETHALDVAFRLPSVGRYLYHFKICVQDMWAPSNTLRSMDGRVVVRRSLQRTLVDIADLQKSLRNVRISRRTQDIKVGNAAISIPRVALRLLTV